jgi:hypothetical protein
LEGLRLPETSHALDIELAETGGISELFGLYAQPSGPKQNTPKPLLEVGERVPKAG